MKTIYIRGGDANEPGVLVMKEHLEEKGHKVVRAKNKEYDVILCWGCSMRDPLVKNVPSLNGNVNLYNKMQALEKFQEKGVCTPTLVGGYKGQGLIPPLTGPWFGRKFSHERGKDITIFPKYIDVLHDLSCDFYTLYVPHVKELRVWVFQGKAVAVYHKYYRNPGLDNYKNLEFRSELRDDLLGTRSLVKAAVSATEALKMDFGAVDILEGKDGRYYVLEVNSMPDISSTIRVSGIRLAKLVSNWAEAQ